MVPKIPEKTVGSLGRSRSLMGTRAQERLRDANRALVEFRHSALLVTILLLFSARPLLSNTSVEPYVFSTALFLILLLATYSIHVDALIGARDKLLTQRRRELIITCILGVPAVSGRIILLAHPGWSLSIADCACWFLLLAFIAFSQLRSMLRQKEVVSDTIAMSISVYLLLGLTWSFLYLMIYIVQPHAFSFATATAGSGATAGKQPMVTTLIYFSLTSLTTMGFGDIVPVTDIARYSAVAEGVTGEFYLAILVARLVGLRMSNRSRE